MPISPLPYDDWLLERLKPLVPLVKENEQEQALLSEEIHPLALRLDLLDAARLTLTLAKTRKPPQLQEICCMLLATLKLRPCAFYIHLLALLTGLTNVKPALDEPELERDLAESESSQVRLAAWMVLKDPVKASSQYPLEQLYARIKALLKPEDPLDVLFHFHLLARTLDHGDWKSLRQRSRRTPLYHSLISLLYQHLSELRPWLPGIIPFLTEASQIKPFKHYHLLLPLIQEMNALPELEIQVRRKWEKQERTPDRLQVSLDEWILENQRDLELGVCDISSYFRLAGPDGDGNVFAPVSSDENEISSSSQLREVSDLARPFAEDHARLTLYRQWLNASFRHFMPQYWFKRSQYCTLWIEDGELSYLFLLWALLRMPAEENFAPLSPTAADLGPGFDSALLPTGQLQFTSPAELYEILGLIENDSATPRFWAFYDFLLRAKHFNERVNTLLTNPLLTLAKNLKGLWELPGDQAQARLTKWVLQVQQELQRDNLKTYLEELCDKGYFSLVFSEIVLRKGATRPRILFLHPLISEKWQKETEDRYRPYVLISGHLSTTETGALWPFAAPRCSSVLWPAINWLSFSLTDSLFMEQVRQQQVQLIQQARNQREKENFERVSQRLDQAFELERQLNTLLENVRQSITPPAISVFGMGHWQAFSEIFTDHARLTLADGQVLYGNHSAKAVTPEQLDAYLRFIREQISPPPGSFIPLFQQAWEQSDRSRAAALKCFGLLKLLCYDSIDQHKDLFWCQLLLALRALGQENRSQIPIQAQRKTRQGNRNLTPLFDQSSDPAFLLGLLEEMDPEIARFKFATEARWRVTHSYRTAPSELLQSIGWLTHQELQPGQERPHEQVRLEAMTARFQEWEAGHFHLDLSWICQGCFDDPARLLGDQSSQYHSTRFHLGRLSQAVNGQWQCLTVTDPQAAQKLLDKPPAPLLILSDIQAKRTWLHLRLEKQPAPSPKISKRSSEQRFDELEI